jgi:hypothetical protein
MIVCLCDHTGHARAGCFIQVRMMHVGEELREYRCSMYKEGKKEKKVEEAKK